MSKRTPKEIRQRHADEARRESEREKLTAHRGMATWGEKLVPLGEFHRATEAAGRELAPDDREREVAAYLELPSDPTPVEGPYRRIAVFGGIYNNHYGLAALLADAAERGADAVYCLGDLGGFGPNPEKVWPLLTERGVQCIQGNYEESLASGHEDCNCGYTDPRDNHFAALSYSYTEQNCSDAFKAWMGALPRRRRVLVGDRELLLVHGSPRRINEFLFESTSATPFLDVMLRRERCDAILCTHSGLQWHRRVPAGDLVNVGVIGRPANDGKTNVWYAMVEAPADDDAPLAVELVPLEYDYQALAAEMRDEKLPEEFVDTVTSGWWTTCLEILPARERAASRF